MHEKTNNSGFQSGLTLTGLYSHRGRVDVRKFGFNKKRNFTIRVAKTKALISCAVTAQLICVFGFAYADCLFLVRHKFFFTYYSCNYRLCVHIASYQ